MQYNTLLQRMKVIEKDKMKIELVIKDLEKKKKEVIMLAWEQVTKDFGSIFGTLLPGANAKLKPPDGKTVMDGLEVSNRSVMIVLGQFAALGHHS